LFYFKILVLMKEGIFRLGGCFNLKNEIKETIDKSKIYTYIYIYTYIMCIYIY